MQSLASQFFAFGVTVLMGITIGILFDVYRVTKGSICPRKVFTYLGDLLFWLISTLVIFFMLLIGNWGEFRLYVIIGILLGALSYIKFLSIPVVKILLYLVFVIKKAVNQIIKILKFIWMAITYPVILMKNIIIIPVGYLGTACTQAGNLTGCLMRRYIVGPVTRKVFFVWVIMKRKWDSLFQKK